MCLRESCGLGVYVFRWKLHCIGHASSLTFCFFFGKRPLPISAIVQNKCGKCNKTVYSEEEMKGADKRWHKACFRCHGEGCSISLDLRNFKAHGGLVYCAAHVPKPKATSVADDVMTEHARKAPQKATEGSGAVHKGAPGAEKKMPPGSAGASGAGAGKAAPKAAPAPEPTPEPEPTPVAEPAPEPVAEPAPEPAAEVPAEPAPAEPAAEVPAEVPAEPPAEDAPPPSD